MSDGKRLIDIESLVQWAAEHSVAPRLTVASRESLEFNYGYTCVPKGFHGAHGGGIARVEGGRLAADIDAERVLAMIDRLDPWTRGVVMRCAKAARRPDWFEGVVPKRVAVWKRCGKRHRRRLVGHRWDPVSPQAICATRAIYEGWHAALTRLAMSLSGKLIAWEINGFAAPAVPWIEAREKAA